ncbi:phospholipase C, phosphocholine-specific [Variovorax paradoxus B4]|uniref:phospholipase C n=1 Tax=Variovorax paradoxus B4 TaxID=1246301 RepID=T1X7E2_VARPD|nr:phospholipase C, phosphocholine-specific [Variovorax paradoxus]AGU48239.1 phospholipase C, phosphocholine-specific [Variovorax paradoxus B4]
MNSRRRFLTGTATTGAAALALSAFPPSIRRALAIPAHNKTGTIKDVEHVVILMQENRSFDHYFGTLAGVRGFGDRFTIPLPASRSVWQQLDATGKEVLPYHFDSSKGNAQRDGGTPHDWADSQGAWDGGRMYQWPRYKTSKAMGYHKDAEIPFQFALANAFTLCDAYHCSMHTGTDANRSFHLTGTNGASAAHTAFVSNEWDWIDGRPGSVGTGYTWKTYAERLEAAGVRWISYQNMPDEWGDNMLGAFRQFRQANLDSGFPVSSGGEPNTPYADTGQPLPYHAYDPATDDAKSPLYKGVANTLPGTRPENYLDAFRRDIREGKLPQVCWMNAPSIYCEHPGPSSPVQGAWFLQEVLDALTAVPEVWSKTVLLVNFDENDGYFDHLPSPSAPSPNGDGSFAGRTTLPEADLGPEYFTHAAPPGSTRQPAPDGRVYGPGPRVPMYVISPWSRGGWVNSQAFDHTSVLRFLEARFGVQEPNIGAFRRAVCGDLTSAFNFANPNGEPLPTLAGRSTRDQADQLRLSQEALGQVPLPLDPQLPRQATGTRPSRALPYELHASARADAAAGTVRLLFSNTGTTGAVFHVYDKLNLDRLPRRYMVEPGKTLDDAWNAMRDDSGFYDLWVLGPNGFHRHFKGDLNALRAGGVAVPEVRVCYDIANGNVYLEMRNGGKSACKFTVRAKAYRTDGPWTATVEGGAKAELHWDLAASGAWYDFTVACDADTSFVRRFAGRVETGRHSVSDPAMGMPDL